MNDIIIKAVGLKKRYRIGMKIQSHDTLGALLMAWLSSPIVNYKRLRSMTSFVAGSEESNIIWALNDVSFEISKGDVVGVIGKNGAGKSTLLKILARITEPSEGRAIINGRVASLLEVGTGFSSELTGRENAYLNGSILGMKKREIDKKFDEIVDFSGVERFIDTPVKFYSSGMVVRLAFAVAAFLEPEVLLVDEVLAVGDMEFQKKCLSKMQNISKSEGRTVIFVSHDMTAIQYLTEYVIFLKNGKIDSILPPEEAISRYLNTQKNIKSSNNVYNRTGDGELKVEKIEINKSTTGYVSIKPGAEIRIRCILNRNVPLKEKEKVAFYIVFYNEMNAPVLTLSNRYSKVLNMLCQEGSSIVCNVSSLCLTPGMYSLMTWLSYNNGFSDRIDNCFEIEVLQGDYYGTGQMPVPRKHGYMLSSQTWSIEAEND